MWSNKLNQPGMTKKRMNKTPLSLNEPRDHDYGQTEVQS